MLKIKYPENMLSSPLNTNDDIQIDALYNKDPDEIFISLMFIYNYDIVAVKKCQFSSFKFKLWDIYSNFSIFFILNLIVFYIKFYIF